MHLCEIQYQRPDEHLVILEGESVLLVPEWDKFCLHFTLVKYNQQYIELLLGFQSCYLHQAGFDNVAFAKCVPFDAIFTGKL